MKPLRDIIIDAIQDAELPCVHSLEFGDPDSYFTCDGCMADTIVEALRPRFWYINNVVRGKCRYCQTYLDENYAHTAWAKERFGQHKMFCLFYEGPLEHKWTDIQPNFSMDGTDYTCSCGGHFRQYEDADPVCPNDHETERIPESPPMVFRRGE